MSDKISKFLAKLSPKDFEKIRHLIVRISANDIDGLDIKPLKGHQDTYRVRSGRIRIVFVRNGSLLTVIAVLNRDERTYKDFSL